MKTTTTATASVSAAGSADRSSAENSSADNSSADKSATGSADKNAATDAPVRVAFTATEPVWLSVKCDGAQSYTGTLLGTETKTFEASNAVTAVIGNAGGVTISLNGKPFGPVGAHGEIRTLELTPSGAHGLPRPESTKND